MVRQHVRSVYRFRRSEIELYETCWNVNGMSGCSEALGDTSGVGYVIG